MEKYTTVITNKNEITKSEFNELDELKQFDKFTPDQIKMVALNVQSLIKKGEIDELSEDEQYLIKSGTSELRNLTQYTINDMNNGRIVKTPIFVQPKQVMWEDTLEKSITGDPIQKGTYLDTPLNRDLDRVGEEIIKGKRLPKKAPKQLSEEDLKAKEEMESNDMYKACMSMVKNGEASNKEEMVKSMSEKYPKMDPKVIKSYTNNVYKAISDTYMQKANEYADMSEDEEEEEKEDK